LGEVLTDVWLRSSNSSTEVLDRRGDGLKPGRYMNAVHLVAAHIDP
jgi:hypothetical protein